MIIFSSEREELAPFLECNAYLDEGNGCWLSKGSKFSNGYGRIWFRGKGVRIHRLAYAVFIGDFDDALCVLHKCDVKHCYYPEHLFLGTAADNVEDRDAKGRTAKGKTHGMFGKTGEKHPAFGRTGERAPMFGKGYLIAGKKNGMYGRTGEKCPRFGGGYLIAGEKHGRAKLKEFQVREILIKHKTGLPIQELAKEYGVTKMAISYIINGKNWKHVHDLAS